MTRRVWARLDNASNIFLAARSDIDPKVFRLGAEMDAEIDPELLQQALDATYARYPLYHSVLRSGVFWYYLLSSDLRPVVVPETQITCAPLYQADRRTLLFRVVYHRRRINLEVFHALSDGTGALWFLTDLVAAYTALRHPESAAATETGPPQIDAARPPAPVAALDTEPVHELTADSFGHYFRHERRDRQQRRSARRNRRGARGGHGGQNRPAAAGSPNPSPEPAGSRIISPGRVHRVRGTRTPDNRTRLVELTVPAGDALALARAEGVSLTMYLTGLLLESIRLSSGGLGRARTLAVSVPVNLRQFFPSTSARNFFATVRVAHTYGVGPDDLGSICRGLEAQFRPMASPEALERKLRGLIRFERMAALRIVPRVLKDVLLSLINRLNNRGLTAAISNLGRVTLPEPAESRVGRMLFHVSAVRPQFCAISHAGLLTISFTSPFVETDHVREFARMLAERGLPVTVAAARATEAELEGAP